MNRLEFIREQKRKHGFVEIMTVRATKLHVDIGEDCSIQDGVILGLDGFGYEKNEMGLYEKFPHYGKVIIGKQVDIYAGTTVQRGSTQDTIIGNGCKIAGQSQIGHNTVMGENCLIGARTIICGSAVLGDNVMTGEFVRIGHGVKIGNNVKISSFTNVTKDVSDDSHVRGIPGEIIS